jgi:catechol 2,3-dioxygenase-like lactoylglutathione lyase family enzyme
MRAFRIVVLATSLVIAGATSSTVSADPIPASAVQSPTVLRRTALIVRDIEASLPLYRDALGLIVVDDRTRRSPDSAKTNAAATAVTRIVLLRSNDDYAGQFELIQLIKTAQPRAVPPVSDHPTLGNFAILFTTQNLPATFAKVKAIAGVHVAEAPHLKTYPAYGRPGNTTDLFSSVFDPDGNFIEINEATKEPAKVE